MKTTLLFLLFLCFSVSLYSQEYIFGKVKSDSDTELANAVIINMRTAEKTLTDKDGNYMISAQVSDELRFLKNGYDRNSVRITKIDYSKPLNVFLEKTPYLIEEIELAFIPSGDLKKDVKYLDPPKKVVALNRAMASYMQSPMTEVVPQLKTPSSFAPKDFGEGQLNLMKLASGISNLLGKATKVPITKANYAESQEFYRRIKNTLDLSFYTKQGWGEEEIDRFLVYADASYSLAKKYRKTFDVAAISAEMRLAYQEYIKTHKTGS